MMTVAEQLTRVKEDLDDVYEAGKRSERDAFWDAFQQNGARDDYQYAFANGWDDDSFRPKYDLRPTAAANMFRETRITDLKSLLEQQGVTLDTSQTGNNISYMFTSNTITAVPAIDLSGASLDNYQTSGVFGWAKALHTIEKLILKDDGTTVIHPNWFIDAPSIANITIEGLIGMDFSLAWTNSLTTESMKSIINHLVDYSGTDKANVYKLTLTDTCWTRLEADGKAPDGGTWKEYVRSLGWNV